MNHPTKDQILKLSLQLLTDKEEKEVQDHLSSCDECTAEYYKIKSNNELIGSLNFEGLKRPEFSYNRNRKKQSIKILSWAAVLTIGFVCGYSSAKIGSQEQINIKPGYIHSSLSENAGLGFYYCEAVDLGGW